MPRWQRILTWGCVSICSLSGVAYWVGHMFGMLSPWTESHFLLSVHGTSAAWVIFVLGTVFTVHIRAGLSAKTSLYSGFFQLFVLVLLITTGILLYYGSEELREATILCHWLLGLGFIPVFGYHAFKRWYLTLNAQIPEP